MRALHAPSLAEGEAGVEDGKQPDLSSEESPTSGFVQLASGSDCVLSVRSSSDVPPGCIVLDSIQQFNLHLLAGDVHKFRLFVPPDDAQPLELVEMEGEVRRMQQQAAADRAAAVAGAGSEAQEVDAGQLAAALSRLYFGRIIAVNELLAVSLGDAQLVVRVTSAHTLAESEREEAIGYHCYRGLLTPSTSIYLMSREDQTKGAGVGGPVAEGIAPTTGLPGSEPQGPPSGPDIFASAAAPSATGSKALSHAALDRQSLHHGGPSEAAAASSSGALPAAAATVLPLRLVNARTRAARPPPTDVVNVTTSDGEWFPVKKKLLRPCLALTKVVRDSGSNSPSVTVDVDCLMFDRVLLFLEAHLLQKPPPQWSLHLVEDLAKAADTLGLRPLADYCTQRLGQLAQGVCIHRYADVVAANARGEVWLILDSMVLDVKAWLPEHPGGAAIIPRQSLNVDCARFFEMYHASRESFLYLRDFYRGEIHPDDRASVPHGGADKASGRAAEPPGPDFMLQLREYTEGFRLKGLAPGMTHNHLGSK